MQISQSEKIIMDCLWETSPLSAKSIIENLEPDLKWHEKTVKTLLNRLLKKKAISFQKNGRSYMYIPILKQSDYVETAANSFVKRVFNGSVTSLVSAFAKREKLSSDDLNELKKLIKEIEND
jgi:predicted transcriptional regulator